MEVDKYKDDKKYTAYLNWIVKTYGAASWQYMQAVINSPAIRGSERGYAGMPQYQEWLKQGQPGFGVTQQAADIWNQLPEGENIPTTPTTSEESLGEYVVRSIGGYDFGGFVDPKTGQFMPDSNLGKTGTTGTPALDQAQIKQMESDTKLKEAQAFSGPENWLKRWAYENNNFNQQGSPQLSIKYPWENVGPNDVVITSDPTVADALGAATYISEEDWQAYAPYEERAYNEFKAAKDAGITNYQGMTDEDLKALSRSYVWENPEKLTGTPEFPGDSSIGIQGAHLGSGAFSTNPEMAGLWNKYLTDPSQMTPEETNALFPQIPGVGTGVSSPSGGRVTDWFQSASPPTNPGWLYGAPTPDWLGRLTGQQAGNPLQPKLVPTVTGQQMKWLGPSQQAGLGEYIDLSSQFGTPGQSASAADFWQRAQSQMLQGSPLGANRYKPSVQRF